MPLTWRYQGSLVVASRLVRDLQDSEKRSCEVLAISLPEQVSAARHSPWPLGIRGPHGDRPQAGSLAPMESTGFPFAGDIRCRVCRPPGRGFIEQLMPAGCPARQIRRKLENLGGGRRRRRAWPTTPDRTWSCGRPWTGSAMRSRAFPPEGPGALVVPGAESSCRQPARRHPPISG
jgi:hypothetical protein